MEKQVFNQINTAQSQLSEVNSKLEDGSITANHILSAYQSSKTVLQERIAELSSPISGAFDEANIGTEQIAALNGILPDDEISKLAAEQLAKVNEVADEVASSIDEPEKSRLLGLAENSRELIRSLGATALSAEVIIVEDEIAQEDSLSQEADSEQSENTYTQIDIEDQVINTESKPETESKQNVTITIAGSKVKIGKAGKVIDMNSKRKDKNKVGLVEARQLALERIVEKGTLKSTEFTNILEDLGIEDVRTYALRWLESLTYNSVKLIERNGKRGHGAAYTVNDKFNLEIVHKDDGSSIEGNDDSTSSEIVNSVQESAVEKKEAIKLDAIHLASVLIRLKNFNPIIEANGFNPIEDSIITELRESGSLDKLSRENLHEIRMQAYQALSDSIEDESFLELEIFEGDKAPNAEDYLFEILNDENSRELFKMLLTANGSLESDKSVPCLVRSENGDVIYQRDVHLDRIRGDVIREKILVEGELLDFITVVDESNKEIQIHSTSNGSQESKESIVDTVVIDDSVELQENEEVELLAYETTQTIVEKEIVEATQPEEIFSEKEKAQIDYVIQRAAELAQLLSLSDMKDCDLDQEYSLKMLSTVYSNLVPSIKKLRINLNKQKKRSRGKIGVITPREAIKYIIIYSGKDKGISYLFKKNKEAAMAALENGINIGLSGEAA